MAQGKKNFIQKAIPKSHRGDLHKALGIPKGNIIPHDVLEAAAKRKGKVGEEARLALTLEGMHPSAKK